MNNKKNLLELLAPARNLEVGKAAILAGADAVYIGGPDFGARSLAGNSWSEIEELVKFAHQYYAKVYLALNTIFFDGEKEAVLSAVNKAYEIGIDALIIQDMGILEMDLPPIPLFASTQTDNYNLDKIKFLEKCGFQRIILARELSLAEIRKIRQETKVPLEFFVHGSLCVSFSGHCYASCAMAGRSANRGKCLQACRLPFDLINDEGKVLAKDKFLLSLKDLNLSKFIPDLIEAGITSFKIEGRLKDDVYTANTVAVYRKLIDDFIEKNKRKYKRASSGIIELNWEPDLEKTFNRGYTDYFLNGRKKDIISPLSQKSVGKLIGKIKNCNRDYIILDQEHDLENADGLCWFDYNNELVGSNINKVENGKIYLNKMPGVRPGIDIFCNEDESFEKSVKQGAKRRVAVDFKIGEYEEGFSLIAEDEDGNIVKKKMKIKKEVAAKPETAEENWQKHFSRLGDTIFYLRKTSFSWSIPYFVPVSILNDWRREIMTELLEKRLKNYPKINYINKKTKHPYLSKQIDYSLNVSNSLSRDFYNRHGVLEIEEAFEKQKDVSDKKIMTTKHCLLNWLGLCFKECGDKKTPEFLYLVNGGKKFKLKFNCNSCEMEIWNI